MEEKSRIPLIDYDRHYHSNGYQGHTFRGLLGRGGRSGNGCEGYAKRVGRVDTGFCDHKCAECSCHVPMPQSQVGV
jgi:hypothetical protein